MIELVIQQGSSHFPASMFTCPQQHIWECAPTVSFYEIKSRDTHGIRKGRAFGAVAKRPNTSIGRAHSRRKGAGGEQRVTQYPGSRPGKNCNFGEMRGAAAPIVGRFPFSTRLGANNSLGLGLSWVLRAHPFQGHAFGAARNKWTKNARI